MRETINFRCQNERRERGNSRQLMNLRQVYRKVYQSKFNTTETNRTKIR